MSDTTTTTPQLIVIDPAAAILGPNVRLDARLDKPFIASIREVGVLEPVSVWQDDDGRYVVKRGQRRTLAAIEAGRTEIPALLLPRPADTPKGEADRIVEQLAENHHRTAMTAAEDVASLAALEGLGLSAAQIAKRTATPRARVATALTVAGSAAASSAIATHSAITLEQAATLAEFDGDDAAAERLLEAVEGGRFDYVAQSLRDQRHRQLIAAQLADKLTAEGLTIIEASERCHESVEDIYLLSATPEGPAYTEETHRDCPGHAAYIDTRAVWGEDNQRTVEAQETHVCTDWRKYGHTIRRGYATPTKVKAADMAPEEREKARAERRDVIESNKAWDSAEAVRRAWLEGFATKRTPPKGSTLFLARVVLEHPERLCVHSGDGYACTLLGLKGPAYGFYSGWGKLLDESSEPRALVVTLTRTLACLEKWTGRHSWRNVDPATRDYLLFLQSAGYTLSDVERRAAGLTKPKRTTTKK